MTAIRKLIAAKPSCTDVSHAPGARLACLLIALAAPVGFAAADDWSLAAGGNTHCDWLQFRSDQAAVADADDFRRARINLTAKYGETLEIEAEHDLKPQAWTDVFVRWNVGGGHSLRVGQFKQPVFLDELTSDKITPLMKQASAGAFATYRRVAPPPSRVHAIRTIVDKR